MADPTGARLRDFDIPVILPRIAFQELQYAAEPATGDPATPAPGPVTTVTCAAPTPTAAAGPPPASVGVPSPKVLIGLPGASRRTTSRLRRSGLPFAVSSDKAISDVEVRLLQRLAKGRLRPLGVTLAIDPGRRTVRMTVLPTPFAKGKLALPARSRAVRAVVTVTARDGSVGRTQVDFTLKG
ncbi:hypothetical protein [Patulibacter sp.]|uniref:hypothetical protein n=1 Tax=Patulibacter sp. TaxID=1912859 RepID=UPI00272639AF|nr:hypothetical protein [Patulibacter sp.]MDO9408941.1 hypothetical protein [Patulibacter sp.]